MPSKLVIEILPDGTIKTNATEMIGTEKELLADLEALAKETGGELKVEKHVPGSHTHTHDGVKHTHKAGQK
jgi:hypothetical protein